MNKEQYLQKRKELMDQAQAHVDAGELDEAENVMNSITDLDQKFERAATVAANMRALQENMPVPSNVQNIMTGAGNIVDQTEEKNQEELNVDSNVYREAFFNKLMGNEVTNEQERAFMNVNPKLQNALTGESTPIVVPTTTSSKIWRKVGELYPFYQDCFKMSVRGNFELVKEKASSDAKWYDEATPTDDGNEELEKYQLTGCELARSIDVSWKLKKMSMDDFENYIIEKMAKKMGAALGYASVQGKGKPTASEHKPEPLGVATALQQTGNEGRVVEYTTNPTYSNLTTLFSKVKSAYKKTAYATNDFIWNVLANIKDKNDRPYFVPDATSGGVGRLFGAVVKEDDSVPADMLLLGDASAYTMNFNEDITLDTEENKKKRTTSYLGYAIADGAPEDLDAFALLKKKG